MPSSKILISLAFVGAFMIALAFTAIAQPAPFDAGADVVAVQPVPPAPVPTWTHEDPATVVTSDPTGWANELYRAVKSGDYWYAVGLVLALFTLGFRALVAKKWVAWFGTDRGGVAAAGVTALLSTGALLLIAQKAPSWALLWAVLTATLVAMGGYVGVKRLLWPKA